MLCQATEKKNGHQGLLLKLLETMVQDEDSELEAQNCSDRLGQNLGKICPGMKPTQRAVKGMRRKREREREAEGGVGGIIAALRG